MKFFRNLNFEIKKFERSSRIEVCASGKVVEMHKVAKIRKKDPYRCVNPLINCTTWSPLKIIQHSQTRARVALLLNEKCSELVSYLFWWRNTPTVTFVPSVAQFLFRKILSQPFFITFLVLWLLNQVIVIYTLKILNTHK